MGLFTKEGIEELKEYYIKILDDFRIYSVRDVIFAILILGQYFQCLYSRELSNGKYASGSGVVNEIMKDSLYYYFTIARNNITHPLDKDIFTTLTILRECLNNYNLYSSDAIGQHEVVQQVIKELKRDVITYSKVLEMFKKEDSKTDLSSLLSSINGMV